MKNLLKLFVCIIGTGLLVEFASAETIVDSGFALNSYPVAGDYYAVGSAWCSVAGEFAALCSTTGTLDETTKVVVFKPGIDGLEVGTVLDTVGFATDEPDILPKLVLPNCNYLGVSHDVETGMPDDPRENTHFLIFDSNAGAFTDITPTNLIDTTPWICRGGPSVLWSEEQGLTQFIYEPASQCVVLWQGREQLVEIQRTPPILACGRVFVDGRQTRVEITKDGVSLIYDYANGKLIESGDYSKIGQALAELLPEPGRQPTQVVITSELAIFKEKEHAAYRVISVNGSHFDLPRISSQTQTVEEFLDELDSEVLENLDEEGVEKLAKDYLLGYEREAGHVLPPDVIHIGSYITPVSESCVGIFDQKYQRLITIELAH